MKIYLAGNSGYWPIKNLLNKTKVKKILISYHFILQNKSHYIDKGLDYVKQKNSIK